MDFYNNVLVALLSTIGGASILTWILKKYIIEKLKGEIRKNVEKDLERYKGEIQKDVEEFRGNITRDIEVLKIIEGRTNILTSRYVEVVTNQRILWLEKIRDDISDIVSLARIISFNKKLLEQFYDVTIINEFIIKNKEFNISNEYMKKLYEKEEAISKLFKLTTKLKLRLNPTDDEEMIILLSKIEDGLINKISKEEMSKILDELVKLSQSILKVEWEKVKKEVKEGKEDKGIYNLAVID